MLVSTIIIPFMLAGLRLALNNPDAIFGQKAVKNEKSHMLYSMICLLLMPLHSMILHLKMHYVELQIMESKNKVSKIWKEDEKRFTIRKLMAVQIDLLEERDRINFNIKRFQRSEIGLESVFQIFGVIILLLNKLSETRTHKDPIHILDEKSIVQSGTVIDTIGEESYNNIGFVLLISSITWSFISNALSHLKGLSVNREHFPLVSKCLAGFFALITTTKRVFVMVLFFTPPLGLLNVLRHWQAEKYRWHIKLRRNFVYNNTIQFGNSDPMLWSSLYRWDYSTSTPPSYELYSVFSLKNYLISFLGLFVLQLIIITLVKWKFSFAFNEFNILDHFIHAIENIMIPYNVKEWSDVKSGNREDHKIRMVKNRKEGIILILISAVFNCLHLVPLIILGMFLYYD